MKLAVGCITFNCKEGLERLIYSCYGQVDYIFVIDGKFKFYPDDESLSTDGTRDMVKQHPQVILYDAPDLLEHEKRQKYLDLCKKHNIDFLLICDDDEYVIDTADWNLFREQLKTIKDPITNIKSYTSVAGMIIPVDHPRLWKNPGKMEYKYNRHFMFGLKGSDESLVAKNTLYSIKMIHDPSIRDKERTEKHDQYIKKLVEYETMKQLIETNREKAYRLEASLNN